MYAKELKAGTKRDIYTSTFTADYPQWLKASKCPWRDEWIYKMWSIDIVEISEP
jgi:hypothetical protein